MPTTVTKIVDPDNGSGTHYTSLAAFQAGEHRNLVLADEIACAKCRCTAGTPDSSDVDFSSWTTDATRYVKVWTDPGEAYRPSMVKTVSGNVYRHTGHLYGSAAYFRMDGIHWTDSGSYGIVDFAALGEWRISNCFLASANFVYSPNDYGVPSVAVHKLWNTVLYNSSGANFCYVSGTGLGSTNTGAIGYLYNVTAVGSHYGFFCAGPTQAKNCIAHSNDYGSFTDNGAGGLVTTNCAADDGGPSTFGGSGNRDSQTFTFVDEANGDFRLDQLDMGARGFGIDLSADATLPFSDDIDGEPRYVWDIGADGFADGDNFNRSDRNLGGDVGSDGVITWLRRGGGADPRIASNVSLSAATASECVLIDDAVDGATGDQRAAATMLANDSGVVICKDATINAIQNFYLGYAYGGTAYIFRKGSGGFSALASTGGGLGRYELRRVGNDVILALDGVDILTAAGETTYMTGKPGLYFGGTTSYGSLDNYRGGPLDSGAPAPYDADPASIASAESFGSVSPKLVASISGVATVEAFGAVSASLGVAPSGLASTEAFGSVAPTLSITLAGVASAEAIGSPIPAVAIAPTGIASAEALGTVAPSLAAAPSGIASPEGCGAPAPGLWVTLQGIPSAASFGTITMSHGQRPAARLRFTTPTEPRFTTPADPVFNEGNP